MEIKLRDVTKFYYDEGKSTKGLEGVNLDFKTDGSWVAITGESGAGKSTLIKILTGLEDIDEGEISFDGKPLSGLSESQRQKLYTDNISFVFQDYNLAESVSAQDNIALALIKQGIPVKDAQSKALAALKRVGLDSQARARASKLSGGERQRVAIARSLALETQVIIFDEPTGNLDNETSKQIIDLINSVKGNRLIVYVTHDYDEVSRYVTRHIVLKDGHVIKDEAVNENAPAKAAETAPTVATAPQKEKKFGFFSYVYASSLFCFSRIGRFLSTLIVLALGTAGILGVAYGYSASLVASASFGSSSSRVSTSSAPTTPEGNRVDVIRSDSSVPVFAPSTSPLYVDEEGYSQDQDNFGNFIYEKDTITNGLATKTTTASLDSVKIATNSNIEYKVIKEATDPNNGYYLMMADSDFISYQVSSYSSAFFDKDLCLSSMGTMLFGYRDISEGAKALILAMPTFRIKGIVSTKETNYSSGVFLLCDSALALSYYQMNQKIRTFLKSDPSFGEDSVFFFSTAPAITVDSLPATTIRDEEGNAIGINSTVLNDAVKADPTLLAKWNYTQLVLPKAYQGKKITFSWMGMSVSSNEMDVLYVDLLPNKSFLNRCCYLSSFTLNEAIYREGLHSSYYFASEEEATKAEKEALAQGYRAYHYPSPSVAAAQVTVPKISKLDIALRILLLSLIIISFGFTALLMVLIQRILNKFYYRKDYDQMVMSYIGYSRKDTIIINLLQFLSIEVALIAIIYPCFIIFVPQCLSLFKVFPGLILLSLFLNLIFAGVIALPRRAKAGRKS